MERMLRKKKKNNELDTNKIGDELLITNCLFLVGHPTELQHIHPPPGAICWQQSSDGETSSATAVPLKCGAREKRQQSLETLTISRLFLEFYILGLPVLMIHKSMSLH